MPALIDTVERQTIAMLKKKKYVEKWGEHQLRHLIRSLLMQCKGNFREKCLKDFGGDMFNDLADIADDIYNNMDPPTASLAALAASLTQNAQQFQKIQNAQQFQQIQNAQQFQQIQNAQQVQRIQNAQQVQRIQNAQQFQQAMNNFDDDSDGGYYGGCCFHGLCTVDMFDGTTKLVQDLKKGDKIASLESSTGAFIVCVVKTKT